MKKIIVLLTVFSLLALNAGFNKRAFAQSENIEAETVAEELAARSGGRYVKGETAPALKGQEVALPIVEEETGKVLGHVVADKAKLVSVLNDAGLSEVANALAAMGAGEAAGETVAAGMSGGTITWIAIGVAAVVGLGVALGGGGGGGGGSSSSTSNH